MRRPINLLVFNGFWISTLLGLACDASASERKDLIYRRIFQDTACRVLKFPGQTVLEVIRGRDTSTDALNPAWGNPTCDAGYGIAAAHDGAAFTVWDGDFRSFSKYMPVEGFPGAQISAGEDVAAAYDGANFIVYDKRWRGFQSVFAARGYVFGKVSAGESVAISYDGNDLWAYNANTGLFDRAWGVERNNMAAEVIAGRSVAMAFDGTTLYGYCADRGQWVEHRLSSPSLQPSSWPVMDRNGETVGIYVRGSLYAIDRFTCQFSQR